MAIYRFSDSSAIKEAIFHEGAQTPVAFLLPGDSATPEQILQMKEAIELGGFQTLPVTIGDQGMLQVTGFNAESELQEFLKNSQFTQGPPRRIADAQKDAPEIKKPSFIKRYSLQLAGVLNLIGDVGFFMSGVKTKDPSKIAGGALYTLGGANLAVYGKTRPDYSVQEITEDTADIVKDALGEVPAGTTLAKSAAKRTTKTFGDSLYSNAAQNTLGVYTAGAGAMLSSGIKKYHDGKGATGLYYGVSSLVFKVASFMIPEKTKHDTKRNKHKRQTTMSKVLDWIHEKPLRLFGYGSAITDTFLTIDSYRDFKRDPKNKSWAWSGVTAGTYIIADMLIGMSNKDHHNAEGKLSADAQRNIEAQVAEVILLQPEAHRIELISEVATFLADQPNTTGTVDDIKKSISEQVAGLAKNRWVRKVTQASTESPQPSMP